MREITVGLAYSGYPEPGVSRERLRRDADADAGRRADRLRRRESVLHSLEVARRRRRRGLVTRFTWEPSANWDDVT